METIFVFTLLHRSRCGCIKDSEVQRVLRCKKKRKVLEVPHLTFDITAVHLCLHKMALVIHVSSSEPSLSLDRREVFLQVTNLNTDTLHTLVFTLLHPRIASYVWKRRSDYLK